MGGEGFSSKEGNPRKSHQVDHVFSLMNRIMIICCDSFQKKYSVFHQKTVFFFLQHI